MIRPGFRIQSVVVSLILVNAVIFLFTELIRVPVPQGLVEGLGGGAGLLPAYFRRYGLFIPLFALVPALIVQLGWVWQVFTYMFLHGSLLHLFFNMYALLLFGRPLEQRWGNREFFLFYAFSGVGAGAVTLLWNLFSNPFIPTLGASGAVFALVLAFGLEFPNAVLLLFFLVPVRAKYAAFIFGGIELVMILTGSMTNIGHFTHLAGLAFGYLYYVWRVKGGPRRRIRKKTGRPRRPPALSARRKREALDRAEQLRQKLASGSSLTRNEETFLSKLRESYTRHNREMCAPEEFDPKAEDCLRCESLYACLYRYVLEIK